MQFPAVTVASRPLSLVRQLLLSIPVVLASASGAQAQDLCAKLDTLIEQSGRQFAEIVAEPESGAGEGAVTVRLDQATYCRLSKQVGGRFYHCGWEFPHRAVEAYETFEAFAGEVKACLGPRATLHADQAVNHPDFYDLRRYELAEAEVVVSVKDKSALGQTIVFIRVQGRAGE